MYHFPLPLFLLILQHFTHAIIDFAFAGQITHATFISGLRLLGVKHLSDQQTFQLMQKHRNPDNFSGLMTRKEFESCINELMNGMCPIDSLIGMPLPLFPIIN